MNKLNFFTLILLLVIMMPAYAQNAPIPILIDTDMAADDWMAILYLLQHSGVAVQAITVTGAGEAHCEPGVQNALDLLALAGNPDIPVACGREMPLQSDHSFPDWLRDSVDSLAGLTIPTNPNPPFDGTAIDLLTDVIQNADEKITLVTLGPLTNIAEALQNESSLVDNIEMICIMGGAVDVAGNVGFMIENNAVAEANIYVDPHAANIVFASGAPITLVPLDATNHAPVTMDFYQRLEADRTSPEADFVYQVLTQNRDFIDSGFYFFWDPLAAAIATDESLTTFEERRLIVIEDEVQESGRTVEDESGSEVRVAVMADGERFETMFLDVLNAE
jgi:inosine-uridine nucleoside N-ribohydrolase